MIRVILFICCLLMACPIEIIAQDDLSLHINDKIPATASGKTLDCPSRPIHLSEFKGKLIILDFWNTRCSSCIASMPKMNALQQQYKDNIQVIYVTKDSRADVQQLFSRIKVKKPDVPFITDDTIFNAYFPHNGDPFHVWIDQKNKVYALTYDYCTDSTTISNFLNGNQPQLIRRWDYGIDQDHPFVSEQNGALLNLANDYSIFFKSLAEYSNASSLYVEKDSLTHHPSLLRIINAPLVMLYAIAFDNDLYGVDVNYFNLRKNNRIIFETRDSLMFFPPHEDSLLRNWTMNDTYCYEIKVSKQEEQYLYKRMQEDLNRYLLFDAVIERRSTKCLVLKRTSGEKGTFTECPGSSSQIEYNDDHTISIQNMPTGVFVVNLIYENPYINMPIIDETGFAGCMNMKLKSRLSDIKALNLELQQYGFTLCEDERELNMLVLKDKAYTK